MKDCYRYIWSQSLDWVWQSGKSCWLEEIECSSNHSRRFSIHKDLMLFFQVSGSGSTTLMWTMTYWLDMWSYTFPIYVDFERTETYFDLLHTVAAQLVLYLPPLLINSQCCVAVQRDRRGNAHTSGHISCNFLKLASWRLYEIRQPPICLCSTSNFFSNTTIETCMFSSMSFGDTCSNYLWREIPKTGQLENSPKVIFNSLKVNHLYVGILPGYCDKWLAWHLACMDN